MGISFSELPKYLFSLRELLNSQVVADPPSVRMWLELHRTFSFYNFRWQMVICSTVIFLKHTVFARKWEYKSPYQC